MRQQDVYIREGRFGQSRVREFSGDVPYNYCEYASDKRCIVNGRSHCLLPKCYHDMTQAELNHLRKEWKSSVDK